MDEKNMNSKGSKPLEPELQRDSQSPILLGLEDEIALLHGTEFRQCLALAQSGFQGLDTDHRAVCRVAWIARSGLLHK